MGPSRWGYFLGARHADHVVGGLGPVPELQISETSALELCYTHIKNSNSSALQ